MWLHDQVIAKDPVHGQDITHWYYVHRSLILHDLGGFFSVCLKWTFSCVDSREARCYPWLESPDWTYTPSAVSQLDHTTDLDL